jgi:trimethylamine-N-oxide reductase (cytochrome c)
MQKKRYYVVPTIPIGRNIPHGMIEFYEDREKSDEILPAASRILFERLSKAFPNDRERPPVPHWVEKSDFHDERISSIRAKKYPLLVVSNHPRWRVHAQMDDINWFHEIPTGKVNWSGQLSLRAGLDSSFRSCQERPCQRGCGQYLQ